MRNPLTFLQAEARKLDITKLILALFILIVSFGTRFFPLTQPDSLVFDEVYFVPQVESYIVNRYFFDQHPPLGKFMLYLGTILFNPEAEQLINPEALGNKVDGYDSPLNLEGIRFFPKVLGTFVPVLAFLLVYDFLKLGWRKKASKDLSEDHKASVMKYPGALGFFMPLATKQYAVPLLIGLLASLENILIVESRYGLLTQILLFFMLLACWVALRYFFAQGSRRKWLWLILAGIALGLCVSVKLVALAVLPLVVILVLVKEWRLYQLRGKPNKFFFFRSLYNSAVCLLLFAVGAYMALFAWHFNQLQHYSPAANELSSVYIEDLKNGTNNASFFRKLADMHMLMDRYNKYVPALDYTKKDEIGSQWVTWPIMARPIDYYHSTSDGGQTYSFIYLIGNPVNWALGLLGVILLTGFVLTEYVVGTKTGKFKHFKYLVLLLLFFGNWLPFALILRVMYLYHYVPALMFSLIIFGVVLGEDVLPTLEIWVKKLGQIVKRIRLHAEDKELVLLTAKALVILLIFIISAFSFLYFSPFTYLQTMTKEQYQSHTLLKEWHMIWPGER